MAFYVVPSAVAFVALGDVLASILYRGGRFGAAETVWVWRTLGGAALGLVAATSGRLFASAFYALKDTRTPVRFALARVAVSSVIAVGLALALPRTLAVNPLWGVAGLTLASSAGSVLEYTLLRRALRKRLSIAPPRARESWKLWAAAITAAGLSSLLRAPLNAGVAGALLIVAAYGLIYLAVTWRLGVPEMTQLRSRVGRLGWPGAQ
jgi:putative peptidoglycan lipid II flippase